MAYRQTQEELRGFTIAFISLLEEDLNSSIFSDIKNIFRDVYRQKLMSILMASGSKMEVKIKCKSITVRQGEVSISSFTSEDDDALIILTSSSNVHIGRAIMNNIKKKNLNTMLPLQIMVIDGENAKASVPCSGIIENPDIPVASLLCMNTVTMEDLPETNSRTSDKDGIESHRNIPTGLASFSNEVGSSRSTSHEVSDICSQRPNPIFDRRVFKQRKTGCTADLMTSKSCEPCVTTSKKEQESQKESEVHHLCRRSLDELSCLDTVMKLHSEIVHKTTDMYVRVVKLNEDTSRLFPKMTKQKSMSSETMDSQQNGYKSWKAPFFACAQILRRMSAPENSRTQSCDELKKDPKKEINDKKEFDIKTESKHNEGRKESEKYNFPKTLMQNCQERSKSHPGSKRHPGNNNTNPLSNASVPVFDASLNNELFVDIFENLCQIVHKLVNCPCSNRRITDPSWINFPLTQITMKRKVTA